MNIFKLPNPRTNIAWKAIPLVGIFGNVRFMRVFFGHLGHVLKGLSIVDQLYKLMVDELKSHPFAVHFSDLFLSKKTDLCAEIWNNSPNCYAARNSRERGIFVVERAEGG